MLEALNYVTAMTQPVRLHKEITKMFPSGPAVQAANYEVAMLNWIVTISTSKVIAIILLLNWKWPK